LSFTEEIVAAARLRPGIGRFANPEFERAYRHDYFVRSLRPVRAALALAIGLFLLFSALDPFVVDEYRQFLVIRLAIVVPVLGALLAFTYSTRFESWFLPSQLFAVVFGGASLIYLGSLSDVEVASAQVVGLVLAILWTHSVSRLPFMLATSATFLLSLFYLAVELQLGRLQGTLLVNNVLFLASANLIGMIGSYTLEAGYRRDFEQRNLLEQRRRELQESMDRLHEAEKRVSELELRAPDSIENLPRWAEQVAGEIRRTVEAVEVRIWRHADGQPVALNPGELTAPELDAMGGVEMAKDAHGNVLVPLSGLSGEVFGAIVISQPSSWGAPERRLVGGFARYLGGALEILEKRHELALEEARRETARRRMRERGVGALWLCQTCGRCYDDAVERCEVDGTRLSQRLLPFRVQDRYQLVRLLGQGGMGQVFLARDDRLQRDVAIKVLLGDSPLDANARAQLAHEARAVARIGHPGVVDVFDLGELDDGSAFIVMEYLTGRALSEEIARHGRGSPRQVAELLRQVGAALSAAHRTGVVHRDIKPQNVFLTRHAEGFHARLLDFGVARVAGGGADTTRSGALPGTPAYMAPEQIGGAVGDEKSDLYSLAAVAFEALVGRRLIKQRPSMAATLAAILNETPPDVSSFLPDAAGVDALFRQALNRDPLHRPASVVDWTESVASCLESLPNADAGWPLPITHELSYRGAPVASPE
jgi:predicted Ser/Thr protein kinase